MVITAVFTALFLFTAWNMLSMASEARKYAESKSGKPLRGYIGQIIVGVPRTTALLAGISFLRLLLEGKLDITLALMHIFAVSTVTLVTVGLMAPDYRRDKME